MSEYSVGHVAIIPDGNRRWAKGKDKQPWQGHQAGFKSFEAILKRALELDIYCISFWGMSTDNRQKRPAREVLFLFRIFERVFKKALGSPTLKKHDVRINVIGQWRKQFPKRLVHFADKLIHDTRGRKKHMLNLLLCYDGKSEMMRALQKAILAKKRDAAPKEYLYTNNLPPVDLVIRTGGDPHLSAGFMMWDVADAQLHFSKKLWPDFTPDDFERAVQDFLRRERRFGA